MIKTIISTVAVASLLTVGAIFEVNFIHSEFNGFAECVNTVYVKVQSETATEDDVYSLQEKWLNSKSKLHAFIPHNEIKEFDLWIAESVKLVKEEKWEDALSKLEVVKELTEQVPKTFEVNFANIF